MTAHPPDYDDVTIDRTALRGLRVAMTGSGDVGVIHPDGRVLAGTWVEAINLGMVLQLTGLVAGQLVGAEGQVLDRVYEEAEESAARTLRASLADPDMLRVAEVVANPDGGRL